MTTPQFWIDHNRIPDTDAYRTFLTLTPSDCTDVLDTLGLPRVEGVNFESPENRVFGFGDVVLKFYRPGRWSLAALRDEVQFLEDLRAADVPFVRPLGELGTWRGIHYLAYQAVPKPFRADPDTLDKDSVRVMVHRLAQIHDVGAARPAPNRPQFDPDALCTGCFEAVLAAGLLPRALEDRYRRVVERLAEKLAAFRDVPSQRVHGDSYSGNALWRPDGPVFMDLDDFQMGPVAIDVALISTTWRLDTLPADMDRRERRAVQHQLVLDLYREVRPFPPEWEPLVPLVRACRGIQFDNWFSARWHEPGFAQHYPDEDPTNPAWWQAVIEGFERATSS